MTIDPEVKREIDELKTRVSGLEWLLESIAKTTIRSLENETYGFKKRFDSIESDLRRVIELRSITHRTLMNLANDFVMPMRRESEKFEKRIEKLEDFQSDLKRRARTY